MLHKFKKISVFCMLLLTIAGCGFEPLYVERKSDEKWYYKGEFDTSISDEIAQIKIEPIADRLGQLIRNDLLDNLTPKGIPSKPKYRLEVFNIKKSVTEQAMRDDITATREKVRYTVQYRLFNANDNKEVVSGNSIAYLGYDIMANPYSTTYAQKKIEKDAAKILANDISLRMGAYFHSSLTKRGNPNEF